MRISVCVKYIADYDMVSTLDWQEACEDNVVDLSYANNIINPYDSYALEFALRVADKSATLGIPVEIETVTIGDDSLIPELKTLYALGVNRPVLLNDATEVSETIDVVRTLMSYFNKQDLPDLILFGLFAGNLDTGMVPHLFAEQAGLICVSNVISLDCTSEGMRLLVMDQDSIEEIIVSEYPIVLSVGNVDHMLLRSPTLKDALAARKMTIESIPVADRREECEARVNHSCQRIRYDLNNVSKEVDLRFEMNDSDILPEIETMIDSTI